MFENAEKDCGLDRHVLIVNLGRGNPHLPPPHYELTTYVMPDQSTKESRVAGLALWWWLREIGHEPRSVLFACTDTAWEDKRDAVRAEALQLELPWDRHEVVHHDVPRSSQHLWAVLPGLEQWLERHGASSSQPVTLHLDVTHAFRAIPMAHTWLALYLQRRGLVRLGVWGYGAFDPTQKDLTPYLDLSHFAVLADWAEAVRIFRERLDTAAVGLLIDPMEKAARRQRAGAGAPPEGHLRAAIAAAKEAGPYLRAGLPLEAGISIRQRLGAVGGDDVERVAANLLPAFASLARDLVTALDAFAPATVTNRNPKGNLLLTQEELARQRRLVEAWLRAGMVDAALRALRELIVNRVLLAWGKATTWLSREERQAAEGKLHALAADSPPRKLSSAEQQLRTLWREVRNRRNPFAHAGMEPDTVNVGEAREALRSKLLPPLDALDRDEGVWLLPDLPLVHEADEP